MHVFPDLPELTTAEAERFWLRPRQVIDIAKLDDRDPNARKFFDNISSRADLNIPSEPGTVGKITTRVYSLVSCVMARVIVEEMGRERSARTAAIIARAIADLLPDALAFPTLDDFRFAEDEAERWRVLLIDIPFGANPVRTHVIAGAEFAAAAAKARDWWGMSVIYPHHVLLRCIETYAEVWSEAIEREAKGRKRAAPLQSETAPKVWA